MLSRIIYAEGLGNSVYWSPHKRRYCICAQAVSLYALRTWSRFRASDVAAVLWALAVLKAPPPDVYRLLLEKLSLAPVSAFSDAELSDIYTAYVLLEQHSAHIFTPCRVLLQQTQRETSLTLRTCTTACFLFIGFAGGSQLVFKTSAWTLISSAAPSEDTMTASGFYARVLPCSQTGGRGGTT